MAELPPKARLVVQEGDEEGASHALTAAETLIGRGAGCDISLADPGISREHALISYDEHEGCYGVEDLQSTNGTQVNGKRVRSVTLEHGDELRIGRTRFAFHCED